MLSAAQLDQARRRRALPSLKQQWQAYLLQRIETYKNSLRREELLALGDEAAQELHTGSADQFLLTEILMLETVDRLISKRLRLPSYAKWRKQYLELRLAQREPIHWGVDSASALVSLLPRLESDDSVLVVGAGAHAEACLLAAYEAEVTFLDEDMAVVEQLEARISGEALAGQFMAYVAAFGEWLPPFSRDLDLVVIDAASISGLPHSQRQALLIALRNVTRPGGVHVLVPGDGAAAPEGYISHYPDWDREPLPPIRKGKASRSRGVILVRPSCP
ncbi:MAG: class I SAM-dependent methyltransferase [Gemmatimonadota bacterium]|jgi:SAM-dependent methyltransferase|nr:class I SAM-dependent methyltransferase [Gemmatimonadota bacterium]